MVVDISKNTEKYSYIKSDECFKDLQKYNIFVKGTSTNGGNKQ